MRQIAALVLAFGQGKQSIVKCKIRIQEYCRGEHIDPREFSSVMAHYRSAPFFANLQRLAGGKHVRDERQKQDTTRDRRYHLLTPGQRQTLAELVKFRLSYDAETGILTWRDFDLAGVNKRRMQPGRVAGSDNGHGVLQVMINGVRYSAHEIAWCLHTGSWPASRVGHKEGKSNAFANLYLKPGKG